MGGFINSNSIREPINYKIIINYNLIKGFRSEYNDDAFDTTNDVNIV